MEGPILLAAGGTGGHLFPAHALAAELSRRGMAVELATDERAERYGTQFPARAMHIISSATVISGSPVALARTAIQVGLGLVQSFKLILTLKPKAVVGFGGYPTLPPLFVAALRGIPIVLHEQNAVMGRANRLIAKRATAVATSFAKVAHLEGAEARTVRTGNPVRQAVIEASRQKFELPGKATKFNLLVFGGSQGARFFSDLVPAAFARLDDGIRSRFRVSQQCRPEDLARVRESYDRLGVEADLGSFFVDMADRLAASHLVVARAGASTVAELAVMGRPSLLVPYPHALDQDQMSNASALGKDGGAMVIEQKELTPERLAAELKGFVWDPKQLAKMAATSRIAGRPDAVLRLADLVERVARGEPVQITKQG